MHAQQEFRPDPNSVEDADPTIGASNAAIRRRCEIEAKLIAYRCGWLAPDEFSVRKLTLELGEVLHFIGVEDPLAQQLFRRTEG